MSGHVVASPFMANDYKTGGFEYAETSRPITRSADRSRAAPIIAFAQSTRDEVREIGNNIAGALPAQPGMKQQTYVAMCLNAKNGKRYDAESEAFVTHSLRGEGDALTASDSKPHVAYRQGVRRLMPIECERLQGFPDGWTAEFSDSARYRMLGNAVSVPVIAWIGRRIMEVTT